MVYDNFHYMNVDYRYKAGEFSNYDDAVKKCREIVDDFLLRAYNPDLTPEELFNIYATHGEDPFVIGKALYPYSSWRYAESKCNQWLK